MRVYRAESLYSFQTLNLIEFSVIPALQVSQAVLAVIHYFSSNLMNTE